ncbi:predicted protein [Naegleria gruberi]|uniref:Predicted protein n=1 Tax=Naegleria gruberi TaxID=5762 RepID=D2VT55_NAEGR|nr:uncharacterized protein NAEGRDRAFT_72179 [Naegleria gruberi]EFC40088.1 predicted protein [Naegleria gruberi]|eukprot:XP_002672832.1 predicted protein [Naegleria gruberi strain NEG-M]
MSTSKQAVASSSREDSYKSPIGIEKKRKKDQETTQSTVEPSRDRTERKKKRRKVKDKRKAGEKFCVGIPEDLEDAKRLISLNEIIFDHVQNNYCKAPIVEETVSEIREEYMKFLSTLIEKYSQEVILPNFQNEMNRMKEKTYTTLISQLEKESMFWKNISVNLENDQHMLNNLSKLQTDELNTEIDIKPVVEVASDLTKSLDESIQRATVGVLQFGMLGEQLKQLNRDSNNLQEKVFNQIREHKKSVNPTNTILERVLQVTSNKSDKKETNLFNPETIIGEKDY